MLQETGEQPNDPLGHIHMGESNNFRSLNWTCISKTNKQCTAVGSGGRAVERQTVNRGDGGSIPPTAISKLRQFLHPTFACIFRKRH